MQVFREATAYRYFPTQSDLISATVDASLAPIIAWNPTPEDNTQQRITELLNLAYPQMFKHEGALRGALQVSLQQWAKKGNQVNMQKNDLFAVTVKRFYSKLLSH